MVGMQNFRTAFRGFNREDVVSYIEYINNQHNSQVAQLNTQLQNANEALAKALSPAQNAEQEEKIKTLEARCKELEEQLAARPAVPPVPVRTEDELEAYRRAERVERTARERAAQIQERANAVLANVTGRSENAVNTLKALISQLADQLQITEQELQSAVSALYDIHPEQD